MREGFALPRPQALTIIEPTVLHWSALALAFAVIAVSNSSATFQFFAYRNFLVWIPIANAMALVAVVIACRSHTTRRPAAVLAVLWAMMQPVWIAAALSDGGVQLPAFLETLPMTWRSMVLFRSPRRILSPESAAFVTWALWAAVAVVFARCTGRFDSLGRLLALATISVVIVTYTVWALMPLLNALS